MFQASWISSPYNKIWHARLGHLSDRVLKLVSIKLPFDVPKHFNSHECKACPLAKFKKLSFLSLNNMSKNPFDLIHCDIWGPYSQSTYDGKRYFLTTVDDCNRYTWIYMLKQNFEAPTRVKQFFAFIETQISQTMKCFRFDNAKELAMTSFLQENGTQH